jgi:hypothetical protein
VRLSDEQIAAVVAALRDDRSYRYVNAMATELLELRALRNAVLAWDGRSLHVGSGDCIRPSCAICRLDKAIAAERARLGEGGG